MKAQRSFTVRPHLPDPLRALHRLAGNVRWSWDAPTRELFATIDPAIWESGGHDPRRVLAEVPAARLEELSSRAEFCERVATRLAELDAYQREPRWFQHELAEGRLPIDSRGESALDGHRVAYFSPEYGLSEAIPQYSGGLGVLAGDHLKAASDLGVPIVGMGLFYRHGYFRQVLSIDGWQQEHFADLDPYALALELCDDIRVELDLAGRPMVVQIWRVMVGRVPLYLLDSDLPENPPDLQLVTDRLYGGDVEHRLRQEMLLGIGGVKALDALGEPVRVFHTNEGHAGFLGLERIRTLMEGHGLSFTEALEAVRAGSVFTTHTPVPAGIDRFPRELIDKYFSQWAQSCGVTIDDLIALGHRPGEDAGERFNMAVMGMRLAEMRNGVSQLHGSVSREMFEPLWPGVPEEEIPIGHITNGVHEDTWVADEFSTLLDRTIGTGWHSGEAGSWDEVGDLNDRRLWAVRNNARNKMIGHVRQRLMGTGLRSGRSQSDLGWVGKALDPDTLTICFARRMAAHKRAALLLSQPERLRALLADDERPVQFVFAGKAHPADDQGKEMIRRLIAFAQDPSVRARFVFVEDYDMELARVMVQGSDVWLNTPLRPLEASGTSGMKAVLNGALHCSVLDGWWAESFSPGSDASERCPNGWALSSAQTALDDDRRSELEANSLFELLETQIVPLFYERSRNDPPTAWLERVKESLRTLGPFVSAHRMARDYVRDLYLPAAERSDLLAGDNWAGARELARYLSRLDKSWRFVRILDVHVEEAVGELGSQRPVTANVALGDLSPEEVKVQLIVGRVGQSGELERPEMITMADTGMVDPAAAEPGSGVHIFRGEAPLSMAGRMGVTVRALPDHRLCHTAADLGHVAWAR